MEFQISSAVFCETESPSPSQATQTTIFTQNHRLELKMCPQHPSLLQKNQIPHPQLKSLKEILYFSNKLFTDNQNKKQRHQSSDSQNDDAAESILTTMSVNNHDRSY